MIDYEYLQYWYHTVEYINLLGNLIKENIEMYQATQNIEHLEYILENVKEILRLIPKRDEYY